MALARNTVIKPVSAEIPVLQIPFEPLLNQMQQFQSSYDALGQLQDTMPQYIQKDAEWADKYRQYASEVSGAVTNAFAEGDTSDALRLLRSAGQALADEWKPGGLAYALQERHSAYTKGLEDLQKAHEKDPTQMNFAYGKHMFESGVDDLDYDYTTRKYNQIATPNIYNYNDIGKRLREEVKTILPDVTENDFINGLWIQRLKEKGYSQDRINAVWQGVLSSPEIQQQLRVEAYGKVGALSPEEKERYVLNKVNELGAQSETEFKSFKKLSDIDKQKYLQKRGFYNGQIDGIYGPISKQAEEEYLNSINRKLDSLHDANPDDIIINDFVVEPYQRQFFGYFGKETSNTLRANQVALTHLRMQHAKKLQEAEFSFYQQYMQQDADSGLYSPTQAVDISAQFNKQRKEIADSKQQLDKTISKLGGSQGISSLYGTTDKDISALDNAVKAFERSGGKIENFATAMGLDKDKAAAMFADLQENAADYKGILLDVERVAELDSRLQQQEQQVFLEGAKETKSKAFSKYGVKGESQEDFVKSLQQAAKMTPEELGKSSDPKLKRFYKMERKNVYSSGSNQYIAKSTTLNLAEEALNEGLAEANKRIKTGEYAPKSMPRFSMSGSNPKYGAGMIADRVKKDLKTGSFYGYRDFTTGALDNFTDIHGKKIDIENLDGSKSSIEYDSGWGKPSYIITAYDTDAKKMRTFRVQPPETHMSVIGRGVEQELAIAINEGNLENAGRAARFREEMSGNLIDLAAGNIKPSNKNIAGNKLNVRLGDNVTQLNRSFTSVYTAPYTNEYNLEIVTYYDKNGKQKWATTIKDKNNTRWIVGKAEKQGGLIAPKTDHTNIADMTYSSYHDALNNTVLLKAVNELPVDDIYSTIPKDLKGIGLGNGKLPIEDSYEEPFDYNEE